MQNNEEAIKILSGAIQRLDKANNRHMKALQADLVHDLTKLIEQDETLKTHGVYLPFCARLNGELTKDDLMGWMIADLELDRARLENE